MAVAPVGDRAGVRAQQLEDPCVDRVELLAGHLALGGGRLVGDDHDREAGVAQGRQRLAGVRRQAHVGAGQRRLWPSSVGGIRHGLDEHAVAVEKDGWAAHGVYVNNFVFVPKDAAIDATNWKAISVEGFANALAR